MNKKIEKLEIKQIFKDNEYEYSQLKESVLQIRQRERKQVYYITACKRCFTISDTHALIFISQSAKKTTIGLIQQCRQDIEIPLIQLPAPNAQLEITCINAVQHTQRQNQLFIFFKSNLSDVWKIKFDNSEVRDKWLELINYKNSILKQEYNKLYQNAQSPNLAELYSSNSSTRRYLIKTKMQRQFEQQISHMSLQEINEVLGKQNNDFAKDKQNQRAIAEQLQRMKSQYTELQDIKEKRQKLFQEAILDQKKDKQKTVESYSAQICKKQLQWEIKCLNIEQLLKQERNQNDQLNKQMLQKKQKWEKDIQRMEQLRNQEIEKKEHFESQISTLKIKLQNIEGQYIQITSDMKHLTLQKDATIKSLNQKHESLTTDYRQITQRLDDAIRQNDRYKQENIKLKQKITLQQNQILQMQQKQKQVNEQINNTQIAHQRKVNEITYMLEVSNKEKADQIHKNQRLTSFSLEQTKQIQDLHIKLKDFASQIEAVSKQIETKQLHIRNLEQDRLLHIFERDALSGQNAAKLFLMAQIQSLTHNKIKYTKLLYFKDNINKINFHTYIDGFSCVCLVVRTSHNHLIAGFSMQPFSSTEPAYEGGILVSMTNRFAYSCRATKRAIAYDDFFLIFGNSELRIRSGETVLFSNFGIANGYYENRGDRVQKLIGDNKEREVEMKNYEIYQVIFQQ